MTAQRRDGDRDTVDSAARVWELYADHIGLPDARPADGNAPLSVPIQPAIERRPRPRRLRAAAVAVGSVVGVVGVVLLGAIAGTALWSSYSPTSVLPERPLPAAIQVPTAETDSVKTRERAATLTASPGPHPADAPVTVPMSHASSSSVAYQSDDTTAARPPRVAMEKPPRASVGEAINFDFGSDRVAAESLRALDRVVRVMKANPDWRLAIEGHTDSHGAPEYNQALSERRAEAVKAYLESAGVAPQRLRALGFGASRPVVPNDGRRDFLNRRVEFHRPPER